MIPRRNSLFPTLAAIAATTLASKAARANDWGTPGLDGAHVRLSTERSGALFADSRWTARFPESARVLSSPVVAEGFLVNVDLGGRVRTLRAEDGQLAWSVTVGSDVQGTPAIDRGRAFVPTLGNNVVALRLADGATLWTRDVGGMALSSPTPIDGDIVLSVGFPGTSVVRLTGTTGEIVWRSPPVMEQFGNTSPAVGGGMVVVGSNGGHYYAFDARTGALRWDYIADGIVNLAAPLISGGRVYFAGGNDSGHVHAVDLATGTAVAGWPIDLPAPEPDVAGTRLARQRSVSSFVSAGGLLVLQTRLDDTLDTDGDGVADRTFSRETVVALDPASGALAWQVPRGRAEIVDPNDVPKFFVCPTPAGFASDSSSALIAAASSLEATVVVLDAATGVERGRQAVAGAALASPVVANGRLHVVAMSGTIEAFTSSVNRAPSAAIPASTPRPLDAGQVALRWLPAVDPDAELPSYELRFDTDGEVLESWQHQVSVRAGSTSVQLSDTFTPGVTYTFAVRARDAWGALSPWSTPETFSVVVNPSVTVGGSAASSLAEALVAARPGEVVRLGAGVYTLSSTLHLNGGITLQGAGAGRTLLDVTGLDTGLSVDGTADEQDTVVDGVSVKGANTCIQITSRATKVRLSHVIARACRRDAIAVAAGGSAAVVNATLVGNGTGVHAVGAATIKNSLLGGNGAALLSEAGGSLASTFNDLFDNLAAYQGLSGGAGDLSGSVGFADVAGGDLRLLAPQSSTDQGDPADSPAAEPAPNGGRINLGAFGGTADAETSALSTAVEGGSPGTPLPAVAPDEAPGATGDDTPGGCSIAGGPAPPVWSSVPLALLALTLLSRRLRYDRRGRR